MKNVILVSGLIVCGMANAAEESAAPSFQLGGVSVTPGLGVVVKNDSNIYRQKNATASTISVVSPSVLFKADKEELTTSLAYNVDFGNYTKDSADNFVDQQLQGRAEYELNSRNTLTFTPSYMKGHDDRGSTFGAATSKPNKWSGAGISAVWAYGAEEASYRSVLDLGYDARTYDNNRSVTNAYDKTLTSVAGTAYFRVMPNTSLLVHAKNTGINYKDSASLLDGSEQRLMAGVKWEASAQTTGEIKVGQLQKKYSSSTHTTMTNASWEALINWSPVSYVNVDMSSSKAPVETTLSGSKAINVSNTGVTVAYDLNDRVTFKANGSQVKEDFIGATRSDSTDNYGIKAEYKFRSWLIGEASYTNSAKTSNAANADFKKSVFAVGIRSAI